MGPLGGGVDADVRTCERQRRPLAERGGASDRAPDFTVEARCHGGR